MINDSTDIKEILNLVDDDCTVIDFTKDGNKKIVTIEKNRRILFCPICHSRLHSRGKSIRHPNNPVLNDGYELVINLIYRKWRCSNQECDYSCTDSFRFVEPNKKNTKLVPLMICNDMKDIHLTCREIAARYHVSDTYVHYTFLQYVNPHRRPLTSIISIDEVHLNLNTECKYALVIMDFDTGEILDIVKSRREEFTNQYFMSIPKEERDGVCFLVTDMYKPYMRYVTRYFKNAVSVVDSFHVIQWLLRNINQYINEVKKWYQARDRKERLEKNYRHNTDWETMKDSREVYILKRASWVLLMNKDNITYHSRHYNKVLDQWLDTYDWEKIFLALDSKFSRILELKNLYEDFNSSYVNDYQGAAIRLNELINIYSNCEISLFQQFANLLKKFKEQIINSFKYVNSKDDERYHSTLRRLSNGPMESFNNVPSSYRTQSHGVDNFEFTRSRILWATRNDEHIQGVPKSRKQVIKENKLDTKRGPYKKKQ